MIDGGTHVPLPRMPPEETAALFSLSINIPICRDKKDLKKKSLLPITFLFGFLESAS